MTFYFSKRFDSELLGKVDYLKCVKCGFCASSTHFKMAAEDWRHLNATWHTDNNTKDQNPWNRDKRYFHQSLLIYLLEKWNIIPGGEWLDYASGEGGLSKALKSLFDLNLKSFDRFIAPLTQPIAAADLIKGGYSLVTNTAMFEHVRSRNELDEIESYVGEDGCLAIHTLVRGDIPADPEWMYLLPVHSAFHTNCSMGILMQQWGYTCSVYNEDAKMWIWFRSEPKQIEMRAQDINAVMGWTYLHFKSGFMDYWP